MRPVATTLIALSLLLSAAAQAALRPGAKAPDFRTQRALAGKVSALRLSDELKRGPVVLYFFPAAFTQGCTLEAHDFAEASDDFAALGARVIGMSADPIDKLAKFSVSECRNKFAVASASPQVIHGFDVKLGDNAAMSNRTSYLIAPNGQIVAAHSDASHRDHVKAMLAALKAWRAKQKA